MNRVDDGGTASKWWPLIETHEYNFIHNAVQLYIVTHYPSIEKEVSTMTNTRIDLYCTVTHEVWEVKPNSLTSGIPAALLSLEKYFPNKTLDGKPTVIGRQGAFKGKFNISFGNTLYEVEYYTPCSGVVLYDFQIKEEHSKVIYKKPYKICDNATSFIPRNQFAEGMTTAVSLFGAVAFGLGLAGCMPGYSASRGQILNEFR